MSNILSVNQYYITIIADPTDAGLLNLISTVDGVYKARAKDTYHCSIHKLPEVLFALRNITDSTPLTNEAAILYNEETQRRWVTAELKTMGPKTTSDWLWPHQCLGVDLAKVNRRFAFFYDTRTGKTLMSLKIMYDALKEGRVKRCLVVCPSAIIQSWVSDYNDNIEHFPGLKLVTYYGDERAEALHTPSHIVVWSMGLVHDTMPMLEKFKFDMCFIDESSKLKSHKSKISEDMLALSEKIPSWYLLSATPAPNNESEYYTQIKTIDPYCFNPARTHFIRKYFDDFSRSQMYEKLELREDMRKEFYETVEQHAIYVDQKVMPVAKKIWTVYNYEPDEETQRVHDEMCADMCATIGDAEITADMAAAMRAKLSQITSGFIMDTNAAKFNKMNRFLKLDEDDKKVNYWISDQRIEELDKILKKAGNQKVVIWANYKYEFKMIEQYLGNKARYINGGVDIHTKEAYIKQFKKGDLQYLVCHPLSVGMGINLTEAHTAIYYSFSDSWEAFKQSSERIAGHIKVQPHDCEYIIMIADGTVDAKVWENLQHKRSSSYDILNFMKGCLHDYNGDISEAK